MVIILVTSPFGAALAILLSCRTHFWSNDPNGADSSWLRDGVAERGNGRGYKSLRLLSRTRPAGVVDSKVLGYFGAVVEER